MTLRTTTKSSDVKQRVGAPAVSVMPRGRRGAARRDAGCCDEWSAPRSIPPGLVELARRRPLVLRGRDATASRQVRSPIRTGATHGDDVVRLVVGGRTIKTAKTNPGTVVRFPFLRPARERLIFVQSHEPGTLRAVVDVDFRRPYRQPFYSACWPYMPPPAKASISFRPST